MKTNVIFLMIFILCWLILTGCEEVEPISCPTCSDEVSWDYYGEWRFRETGYNGLSYGDYLYPPRNAIHIEDDCGWKIYNNHEGGYGDTYEVYSCDTGVIFIWRWSRFGAVILSKGWEGSTKEGIRIGDDLSKFLNTYDYFKPSSYDSLLFEYYLSPYDGDIERDIHAWFSEDKKLYKLYIQKGL